MKDSTITERMVVQLNGILELVMGTYQDGWTILNTYREGGYPCVKRELI